MKKYILLTFIVLFTSASFAQESSPQRKYDFPLRNSVYLQNFIIFPTLNFDRVIPINDHFGLIPKVGFGYYDAIEPIFEASFFIGGNMHFG
jgi:hypothetical protein